MTTTEIRARALVLGDDINTDLLHPPQYFGIAREVVLPGFLAGFPLEFARQFQPGDILVGGRNFGCGSSREAYVHAFRYARVSCVIAAGFARIFYRNLINAGIPLATHPTLSHDLHPGEAVIFNRNDWTLFRPEIGETVRLTPPEEHLQKILAAGGLLRYLGLEK